MTTYVKWTAVFAAALGLVLSGVSATAQDKKDAGGTSYKIGVVNMPQVLKEYKKRQEKYAELQKKVDELQKDIDALSTKIEAAKADYENKKKDMDDAARLAAKNAIEADYQKYRTELDSRQRTIDNMEEEVLLGVMKDVRKVIEDIGNAEGYHLILNGIEEGKGTVLFHSPTIDMTSKVLDKLNG